MKKIAIVFSLVIIVCVGLAFNNLKLGAVIGKVSPQNAVNSINLINGNDTSKTTINQGGFIFSGLKQSVYKVLIKANTPYKDSLINNVAVKDSATTDLGEIKLQQ